MADVVLSGAMRSNLLSMQNTAKLLDQTQQRVSTGLKVNSAIDNPQSFFTAQGLDNRASDLSTLLDSMGLAVQTLKAASQGIDAIQKLVQQAKATAIQALQTTVTPTTQTSTAPVAATPLASDGTLTITVGDKNSFTINLTASGISSPSDLVTAINTQIGALTGASADAAAGVSAKLDSTSGNLVISASTGENLVVSSTGGATALNIDGTSKNGANRNQQVADYNNLLLQINQLAQDSSFNGINLLQDGSKLLVNFNEHQTSSLNINGVDTSAHGIGLDTITNDQFADDTKLKTIEATTDTAIQSLRVKSTSFASSLSIVQSRQDFTKNLINTLKTGSGNLTLADTNEEGANLLALQTRQQLGTSALSIASRSEQSILKLF